MFDTKPYEIRMQQAVGHFEDDLKKVRTGRAHPSVLEGVMVEAYGARMPLNQVGNTVVVESQLLQVTPFDPSNLKAIANAIRDDASLGLNPSDDGRVVRVVIPPLTSERRQQIAKQIGDRVEDCRIVLRNIRHDALKDVKAKKDKKELGEDDVKRIEKVIDGRISEFQAKIETMARAKEAEVLTI